MGSRTPKYSIFIVLIFLSTSIFSQQSEYLFGKLLDAKTGEPVVFASIRIKDRALGVISNVDGSFKIPLKYKEYGDIIEISSMGYQRQEILISDFYRYEVHILRLQPAIVELEETVVIAKRKRKRVPSARQIVKRAIKAIPSNYPQSSFSTIGYYRDYQYKDEVYINLNEAILEVFDQGFDTKDIEDTQVKIYDYKQNLDFTRDSLAADSYDYKNYKKVIENAYLPSYGGNEFVILRVHDAIRNYSINSYDFVNNIQTDMFKNHNFKKEADTYLDDELLYVVNIFNKRMEYILVGRLFISKTDYAIHKMEYEIYNSSIEDLRSKKNKQANLVFRVVTEYQRTDDTMYLNYISFQNGFQVAMPPEFIIKEIVAIRHSKCFEVRFNRPIDTVSAGKKKNYVFKFLGKKLRFKSIVVFDDAVRLFPAMSGKKTDDIFEQIYSAKNENSKLSELLETKVSGIYGLNAEDQSFNVLLNSQKMDDYFQFREFFVQELKLNSPAPIDSLYMHKRKPIFKDQPIVKPDNFDEYWMNTPLKKKNN